jgi:SanA protein
VRVRSPLRLLRGRRVRRLLKVGVLVTVIGMLTLAGANAVVLARSHGRVHSTVAGVDQAEVAIVPGALVRSDGSMSAMLRDRVAGAVALYDAGTVTRILVSGDHHRLGYDETDTMRDAVLAAGVPAEAVFTDYAGFDTWSTMRRARQVFGVRSAVVVTQGFHAARAVDLGLAAGIDTQALTVGGGYGTKGRISSAREVLARVKGLGEATFRPAVLLGPELPISGSGPSSWGPVDIDAPVPAVRP